MASSSENTGAPPEVEQQPKAPPTPNPEPTEAAAVAEEEPRTLERAQELFDRGAKAIEDEDFVEAVDCLSQALEIRAHLGATISGLFFGYLTCPSVEFDNSAKNGHKEAVVLIRRQAHPCKSTAVFFVTILAFAVVAFAYGTQFNNMDLE